MATADARVYAAGRRSRAIRIPPPAAASPFLPPAAPPLAPGKFRDPDVTAKGERRARVGFVGLRTLWFNTGTLCNLACANCYIESTPRNDALSYLSASEVAVYLDELAAVSPGPREVGFTGGEPFLNRDLLSMVEDALSRGHRALVLTNAMRPMRLQEAALAALARRHGDRLTLRVSLDHPTREVHDAERGAGAFDAALDGLRRLFALGVRTTLAGRRLPGESEAEARAAFARRLAAEGPPLRTGPAGLLLFPEMDPHADVPEITDACWGLLGVDPAEVMCATSRMVVKRRGAAAPTVVACTLTPHAPDFDLGPSLAGAFGEVGLNHPHCARFCVLGGASCSAA